MGNLESLPPADRWVCTCELAMERTDLVPEDTPKGLDSLLKHFGLEPRDPAAPHDAYIDCTKTAQLYMKLSSDENQQPDRD